MTHLPGSFVETTPPSDRGCSNDSPGHSGDAWSERPPEVWQHCNNEGQVERKSLTACLGGASAPRLKRAIECHPRQAARRRDPLSDAPSHAALIDTVPLLCHSCYTKRPTSPRGRASPSGGGPGKGQCHFGDCGGAICMPGTRRRQGQDTNTCSPTADRHKQLSRSPVTELSTCCTLPVADASPPRDERNAEQTTRDLRAPAGLRGSHLSQPREVSYGAVAWRYHGPAVHHYAYNPPSEAGRHNAVPKVSAQQVIHGGGEGAGGGDTAQGRCPGRRHFALVPRSWRSCRGSAGHPAVTTLLAPTYLRAGRPWALPAPRTRQRPLHARLHRWLSSNRIEPAWQVGARWSQAGLVDVSDCFGGERSRSRVPRAAVFSLCELTWDEAIVLFKGPLASAPLPSNAAKGKGRGQARPERCGRARSGGSAGPEDAGPATTTFWWRRKATTATPSFQPTNHPIESSCSMP
ncbi:hypothetical protein C7M84_021418 [Penaeus vannamei]|uniref:Uncharacterized protein n=1 Tax=Penaeus vannamei TaxID=6689 RepID=A0A423U8P2_PENVA|nr:hypothetical protein C7M84_021418 [Penaeus vannamei]